MLFQSKAFIWRLFIFLSGLLSARLTRCLAVSGRVDQKILVEWYCFGVIFLCSFQFCETGSPYKAQAGLDLVSHSELYVLGLYAYATTVSSCAAGLLRALGALTWVW